ncbi:MAG: hypothetical protein AB4290_11760 [Spirulina sp.]
MHRENPKWISLDRFFDNCFPILDQLKKGMYDRISSQPKKRSDRAPLAIQFKRELSII